MSKNENENLASGPLEITKCQNCDLVQLAHSYNLNMLYGENYGYRSGLNGSMVRHLNSKVHSILKRIDLTFQPQYKLNKNGLMFFNVFIFLIAHHIL